MHRIAFDFPPGLYIGLPLAIAALLFYSWTQHRRGLVSKQLALSTVLRALALLILIFLVSRPVWVELRDRPRKRVLLLLDRSSSMSFEDGGTTRFKNALAFTRNGLLPARSFNSPKTPPRPTARNSRPPRPTATAPIWPARSFARSPAATNRRSPPAS